MARLGLISDTHGTLRSSVFDLFAGVDRILHAGDIGPSELLAELETIAPVSAVWGNTDGFDIRARLRESVVLELEGHRIQVIHGHQVGTPDPVKLRVAFPDADIVVFGHTHRAVVDREDRRLVVNPGAAGPPRFGIPPSVGLLTLTPPSAEVEILGL